MISETWLSRYMKASLPELFALILGSPVVKRKEDYENLGSFEGQFEGGLV